MKIQEILKQPEGKSLEFKKEIPRNRQNLLKTVVAFANGTGGHIYVGVNDDRTVAGIKEEPFDLEEKLSSIIYDSISPIPNVFFQAAAFKNKIIFIIRILPGANKPYYLKKLGPEDGIFVRIGSTNRKADSQAAAELRRQARNISLDQEIDPSFDCDILDMRLLEKFIASRGLKIKPTLGYLVKIKAAQRYNHACHPTIGGILLFCSTLPDEYSYAGFRVSRFKAENRADLINSTTISDGLLAMPEKIMDFVRLYMERRIEISALRRKEDYDIPLPAIREGILNAICHRDYSVTGCGNKLDIFSDRIEITSPGTLPLGITLQDLGEGISEVRNRLIVKIFREAGYVEQLGTGIMRIKEACRENALPEPRFEETGNFFKVTIFRARLALLPDLEVIYELIKQGKPLGSKEIAEKLNIHQNTVLKRLRQLQEKGLIYKQGSGPHVRYSV
ncbi:putative DNA binding domain-containing protein [Candidatus Bipolaricaulota bacterium]|nr:putative DNA binding domain-containing protein [Candidatus Bipolaricaulota bacterium]